MHWLQCRQPEEWPQTAAAMQATDVAVHLVTRLALQYLQCDAGQVLLDLLHTLLLCIPQGPDSEPCILAAAALACRMFASSQGAGICSLTGSLPAGNDAVAVAAGDSGAHASGADAEHAHADSTQAEHTYADGAHASAVVAGSAYAGSATGASAGSRPAGARAPVVAVAVGQQTATAMVSKADGTHGYLSNMPGGGNPALGPCAIRILEAWLTHIPGEQQGQNKLHVGCEDGVHGLLCIKELFSCRRGQCGREKKQHPYLALCLSAFLEPSKCMPQLVHAQCFRRSSTFSAFC